MRLPGKSYRLPCKWLRFRLQAPHEFVHRHPTRTQTILVPAEVCGVVALIELEDPMIAGLVNGLVSSRPPTLRFNPGGFVLKLDLRSGDQWKTCFIFQALRYP